MQCHLDRDILQANLDGAYLALVVSKLEDGWIVLRIDQYLEATLKNGMETHKALFERV